MRVGHGSAGLRPFPSKLRQEQPRKPSAGRHGVSRLLCAREPGGTSDRRVSTPELAPTLGLRGLLGGTHGSVSSGRREYPRLPDETRLTAGDAGSTWRPVAFWLGNTRCYPS